jgi:SAM-dependent methyltransferase
MDERTRAAYEAGADAWLEPRSGAALSDGRLDEFAGRVAPCGWVVDLGCGPGWYANEFGDWGLEAVGLDLATSMLVEMGARYPGVPRVQADLLDLPFKDAVLDGAFGDSCYQHLPLDQLPAALGELRRVLKDGAPVEISVPSLAAEDPDAYDRGVQQCEFRSTDRPPADRLFTAFSPQRAERYMRDAGFERVQVSLQERPGWMSVVATASGEAATAEPPWGAAELFDDDAYRPDGDDDGVLELLR